MRADQRYCLSCGACAAPRSELLERLQGRALGRDGAGGGAPGAGAGSAPGLGLRLPSPWVSALLVAAFLGFGVLLGNVASSPVQSSLAASRRPTRLILPQSSPTPPSSSASSGEGSSSASGGGETPAAEPEAVLVRGRVASAARAPARSKTVSAASGSAEGAEAAPAGEASSGSEGSAAGGSTGKLPPVKHVFVIALSNEPFASVFGPSSASPYLSSTLEHRGELLVRYYAVAHEELANGIALLSGQGPTAATAANCPTYTDLTPGRASANGQVNGEGCVYPPATPTLPGELAAKHLQWRAYVQGIGEAGVAPCAHPALGQADTSAVAPAPGQAYATFRNPVAYFHSLIDSPACQRDDVGLASLAGDLANPKRTPSFAYIAPDRCHDGDPTPCAPGAVAGMAGADGFLRQVVPRILASKAYKDGGLLVITVDQAPASGEFADSSSCCGQPQFPNVTATGPAGGAHKGGGQVGALLLSPYVKAGTSQEPFNHFSLLRTIEDFFGLAHLGYAGLAGVSSLPASVFSAYKG